MIAWRLGRRAVAKRWLAQPCSPNTTKPWKNFAWTIPVERASGATVDPDDEMVLECALAAEADFIVSGDKKHLLALRQFRSIPIVSPAEFLRRLPAL